MLVGINDTPASLLYKKRTERYRTMATLNLNFEPGQNDNSERKPETAPAPAPTIPGVAPAPTTRRAVLPGEPPAAEESEERVFFQNKAANKALIALGAVIGLFVVVGIIAMIL